jgi:hypothetical protein
VNYHDLLKAGMQHEHEAPPNAASEFLHRVADELELLEHGKGPDQVVRVLCAGPFGVHRAMDIQPASPDALRIVIAESDGHHVIISPLSQCSFMLSVITPSAGEPREKVILGFAAPTNET